MEERFFFCNACGNLFIAAIASGVIPYCCGDEMEMLKPNTTDGNTEKHLPVVSRKSDHSLMVRIGFEPHPMTSQHNIRFICLETDTEVIVRYLKEDDPPEACIRFSGTPVAVYSYCNIHGLWRVDAPQKTEGCDSQGCRVM
ncbi:MAG: desulfoferrodoxin [Bacteroidaceae bacterium]|nr:desulfoferrodoxin [Bacteroidaceae bacterium]